jgi:Fe2+ or Zn2+ uptake regulation protein
MGLIEELHFDDAHHHYEIKPSKEHHHLVCQGCGRIIEFSYPMSRVITKQVREARDFEIENIELKITGYCPACRRSKGK